MDWHEYFFRHVFLAASKSKDPSSKIGAVLVRDNVIISEGYNGFPRGVVDSEERLSERDTKLGYIVHGEDNAILNCARMGVRTEGSVLYTTASPCNECMKAVIQAGVRQIFIHKGAQEAFYNRNKSSNWNNVQSFSLTMAEEAGVKMEFWDKTLGLKTLVGGQEIDV